MNVICKHTSCYTVHTPETAVLFLFCFVFAWKCLVIFWVTFLTKCQVHENYMSMKMSTVVFKLFCWSISFCSCKAKLFRCHAPSVLLLSVNVHSFLLVSDTCVFENTWKSLCIYFSWTHPYSDLLCLAFFFPSWPCFLVTQSLRCFGEVM